MDWYSLPFSVVVWGKYWYTQDFIPCTCFTNYWLLSTTLYCSSAIIIITQKRQFIKAVYTERGEKAEPTLERGSLLALQLSKNSAKDSRSTKCRCHAYGERFPTKTHSLWKNKDYYGSYYSPAMPKKAAPKNCALNSSFSLCNFVEKSLYFVVLWMMAYVCITKKTKWQRPNYVLVFLWMNFHW